MSGATILFGRPLLGLYTSDSEVIEIGGAAYKSLDDCIYLLPV